ncbi:histidine N-alpha-methyltransferase-like isoform X3 [Pecten maximus]|uniref:histidine N-alpha-methyltransferase-like isoform X3 n=1 Tax=Pecten maximus TaxID=6579 RepID=UPI001458AACE|nr:histidine N-alpha-methyltransferase-like isoform X3 [Pecten maximus]
MSDVFVPMDNAAALRVGLTSTPKYLPVWYRYDKAGSVFNDRCLSDNTYYYFYRSEISTLSANIEEILQDVSEVPTLVDMGSGNSEKTRGFIDALLTKYKSVTYIPVDISKEFLAETSDQLFGIYGNKLCIKSIPGDYDVGIERLRDMPGVKVIMWLGGGFQNQKYQDQIRRLKLLSNVMTDRCRLIISLDITQNKEQIENAYLDPTAGLGITLNLAKDDRLYFHEGKGVSCKYNVDQIRTLALCAGLYLENHWTDTNQHVAVCYFSTQKTK